jgi:hypothetical protein
MDFIEELLLTEPYISEFQGYTYIPYNLWDKIPKGSCIKFIDKDLQIRFAGFLLKCINHAQIEKRIYVLKNKGKIFDFRPFFYYIFYKAPADLDHEQLLIIKSKRKRAKPDNKELFKKLLTAL